ncbi:MAG TPA: hypothetical protein VMR25_15700 [Planctomycetaceae bacterium]|nr:hypothetical protein [Planctomycetaceae bacterium]
MVEGKRRHKDDEVRSQAGIQEPESMGGLSGSQGEQPDFSWEDLVCADIAWAKIRDERRSDHSSDPEAHETTSAE